MLNFAGGRLSVERCWWNGVGETFLVELCRMIFVGGTVLVELCWWNYVG